MSRIWRSYQANLEPGKVLVDWVLDGTEAWHYLESQWTQYTLAIFDWLLTRVIRIRTVQAATCSKADLSQS